MENFREAVRLARTFERIGWYGKSLDSWLLAVHFLQQTNDGDASSIIAVCERNAARMRAELTRRDRLHKVVSIK
jgi:hypothetical protein|uniref:ORF-166 protein n=1 Tax=Lymantria dispar multicapsid nuclear polyhedrosis virus TaxID=10449 RepID=V9THJ7_NPVLD|nr:ORF-166 protein [Lymantria dispar multiple nucleopolyhedrovirus]AMO27826.1 hypothetical protein [Lymantria dispar multiple nucleopolyhedrovirus]QCQ67407.1 hypothetical protein [Lymantria dispar multiple nucleopolyhedrovirus]QCQ67567.1 hypothetical protein [Lymantria dispar multiple nucleopolyhedrovirus]QCQ67725.1 hypothetical protein [Lymantria dispar multiple nucleopolyhedrovirus]